MLRIRFSRTGKKGQPSFRIVVAEHSAPIRGRTTEIVGSYLPARTPKIVELNKERILYWISVGAVPTDSVASLLKKEGFEGMDKYLELRNKAKKKKGAEEEKPAEKAKPTEKPTEAPVAETEPAKE